MPGTQTFTPDDIYCVYCHAPAAGQCAMCGALCCAECVELVMGLTVPRAVCRSCVEKGHLPRGRRTVAWIAAGLAVAALGALLWAAL